MKLTDIKTFVVGNPPLATAAAISCPGSSPPMAMSTEWARRTACPFAPHIVPDAGRCLQPLSSWGRTRTTSRHIWRRVYSAGYTQHPDLSLMGVLSALEMACWDIIGKEAGQPVDNLLGGRVHERLRSYTYIYARPGDKTDVYQDPQLWPSAQSSTCAQGFTAIKFDPAGPYTRL